TIYHLRDKATGPGVIPMTSWPAPYDRMQLLSAFSDLGMLTSAEKKQLLTVVRKLASYDYNDPKQTEYLDRISVADYLKALDCNTPGIVAFLTGFCELGYYESIERASALTLAKETVLFAGSPNDLKLSLFRNPTGENFLKPMADYIRAHGGEVLFHTQVNGIKLPGGKGNADKS